MKKLPVIVAAASALWAFPAFAGQVDTQANTEPAIQLAQFDVCVGPDCRRDRDRDRYRDRYYDRDFRRDRGCRDVTIRERRGDEVVVRHVRRCD
jgi:hypothetical protein